MAATTHYSGHKGVLTGSIVAWFEALRDAVIRRRDFRRTYNELSRLSDRQLDDLGLNRSMLRQTAMRTVYTHLR